MSAHLHATWRQLVAEKSYVFDVDFAHSKDTLKEGEIVGGTHRVTIMADDPHDAQTLAEQMVAATGREPTATRRIARRGIDG